MKIIFAGTPDFAAAALKRIVQAGFEVPLVLTQPDRPKGRGMALQPSPVKQTALELGLNVEQPEKLRGNNDALAHIRSIGADAMVVAAYGLILPQTVLDAPKHGCLNIHASLLPRWRGAAPIQRAIEAGDAETGICIMQMDKGLDTGAVWTEARLPITADDTAASLHDRLMTLGSATLLRTLPDVLAQTRQPTPQAADGITYAHKLNKAEARLDWHAPVATLDRKIRAYNPTPIAHTTLDGEALRIHAAHVLNHTPAAAPGTITAHHADGLDVACADGTLRITRLQLPGKTATDAAALRHSRDLTGQQLQ